MIFYALIRFRTSIVPFDRTFQVSTCDIRLIRLRLNSLMYSGSMRNATSIVLVGCDVFFGFSFYFNFTIYFGLNKKKAPARMINKVDQQNAYTFANSQASFF